MRLTTQEEEFLKKPNEYKFEVFEMVDHMLHLHDSGRIKKIDVYTDEESADFMQDVSLVLETILSHNNSECDEDCTDEDMEECCKESAECDEDDGCCEEDGCAMSANQEIFMDNIVHSILELTKKFTALQNQLDVNSSAIVHLLKKDQGIN